MRTILVPVDLTPTTRNAARFALDWAQQFRYGRILLFQTFGSSAFEYIAAAADYSLVDADTINSEHESRLEQLRQFCQELQQAAPAGIQVEAEYANVPLLRGVLDKLRAEPGIELVALGSDQGGATESGPVSEHVIPLAKISPVKLLQIPSAATPAPIQTILVPLDLSKINSLQKLDRIRHNPQLTDAKLLVLNVALDHTPGTGVSEAQVHDYLGNYRHELFQADNKDSIAAILAFSEQHRPDLVIALPGRYSFLYALTHKSLSQAIYRHAQIPVLILK